MNELKEIADMDFGYVNFEDFLGVMGAGGVVDEMEVNGIYLEDIKHVDKVSFELVATIKGR